MREEDISLSRDLLPSRKAGLAPVQVEGPLVKSWLPRRAVDNDTANSHVGLILQVMNVRTTLLDFTKEPFTRLHSVDPHLVKSGPLLLIENRVEAYVVVSCNEDHLLEVLRTLFKEIEEFH